MSVITFTVLVAIILWLIGLTISVGKLLDAVRDADTKLASYGRRLATLQRITKMGIRPAMHLAREDDEDPA